MILGKAAVFSKGTLKRLRCDSAARALRSLADHGVLEPVQARTPGPGRNRNWYAATELVNIRTN